MAEDEAQPGLLTKAQLREGLQNVERTLDGEGYAFSKLDVSGKGLTDLGESLPQYQHVRYLSVADNQLTDISAASGMYSLLSIDARNNKLEAVGDLSKSAFLQVRCGCARRVAGAWEQRVGRAWQAAPCGPRVGAAGAHTVSRSHGSPRLKGAERRAAAGLPRAAAFAGGGCQRQRHRGAEPHQHPFPHILEPERCVPPCAVR